MQTVRGAHRAARVFAGPTTLQPHHASHGAPLVSMPRVAHWAGRHVQSHLHRMSHAATAVAHCSNHHHHHHHHHIVPHTACTNALAAASAVHGLSTMHTRGMHAATTSSSDAVAVFTSRRLATAASSEPKSTRESQEASRGDGDEGDSMQETSVGSATHSHQRTHTHTLSLTRTITFSRSHTHSPTRTHTRSL